MVMVAAILRYRRVMQEIRDWKLESQAQLRTWMFLFGALILIVGLAVKLI